LRPFQLNQEQDGGGHVVRGISNGLVNPTKVAVFFKEKEGETSIYLDHCFEDGARIL
jgi:hypothetical protein